MGTHNPLGPILARWLSEHATQPTVALDGERNVLLVNAAARELFGDDLHALLRKQAFFATVDRDGTAATELAIACPDRTRAIHVRADKVDGVIIVTARDLTAERMLEHELERLRRIEPVGHMTASLAHDLNNVLTVVLTVAELLERELPTGGRAAGLTQELRAAAEQGCGMVRQVLGLLRGAPCGLERGGLPRLLAELRPLLERIVGSGVSVDLDVAPDLGDTSVDRGHLARVLLNLAANARDAMPDGGRLRLQAKNVSADACPGDAAPPSEGYVALLVTDDGVGMPDGLRERVLDGYVTTKHANGTGLGLVGAHRFVTAAGGGLSIRSTPGDGTTIALYLPQVAARSVAS